MKLVDRVDGLPEKEYEEWKSQPKVNIKLSIDIEITSYRTPADAAQDIYYEVMEMPLEVQKQFDKLVGKLDRTTIPSPQPKATTTTKNQDDYQHTH
jgi:hypothetical protein